MTSQICNSLRIADAIGMTSTISAAYT